MSRAILNPGLCLNSSLGSNPPLEKGISQEIWAPCDPPSSAGPVPSRRDGIQQKDMDNFPGYLQV